MLSNFSLWLIYTASYGVDYILLLVISIARKVLAFNSQKKVKDFFKFCTSGDYWLWATLLALIIISAVVIVSIMKIKMNTRVKPKLKDDIVWEVYGYVLTQVIALLTVFFTDYWILISATIFIITGIFFVKAKKVHFTPLFIIPLRYSVHETEDGQVVITRMSREKFRKTVEDNPDGLEARELERGIYFIK